ncbi:hypothetical protein [Bradyrhizobium cajani]|uniref:Uncharacterized protein n=1 Tax=Bradyrhizobium cajani TaxID=1928661 RepID=A0A844TI39_9BRAD|nr:hypothetical protein [Bradyrhizobium cajani]MCP3369793.1 hypothetical protein [Bradyrhizobium cajani]MVT77205.1 hypothetical protein [Bradyrhizobium cajani]
MPASRISSPVSNVAGKCAGWNKGAVGFDTPATDRFGAMLGFVDVNQPAAEPNSLGRGASQSG